ncbi:MAG TPA: hypothetical protein PK530_04605 [Anaerolineales bacterium]|nr:hypothetical protein [Anaerolineales bacterium]
MTFLQLFSQNILYSVVYSLIISLSFLGLGRLNPEIWLNDYPPDIKARFGPMSAQTDRQRKMLGVPLILFMLAFPFYVILQQAKPLTYWEVFGSLLFIYTFFNLVDLLVLDWLVFNTIQPGFIILPGTEGMAGYKDYGFHFRASIKGQIGMTVLSLLGAGVLMLFIS